MNIKEKLFWGQQIRESANNDIMKKDLLTDYTKGNLTDEQILELDGFDGVCLYYMLKILSTKEATILMAKAIKRTIKMNKFLYDERILSYSFSCYKDGEITEEELLEFLNLSHWKYAGWVAESALSVGKKHLSEQIVNNIKETISVKLSEATKNRAKYEYQKDLVQLYKKGYVSINQILEYADTRDSDYLLHLLSSVSVMENDQLRVRVEQFIKEKSCIFIKDSIRKSKDELPVFLTPYIIELLEENFITITEIFEYFKTVDLKDINSIIKILYEKRDIIFKEQIDAINPNKFASIIIILEQLDKIIINKIASNIELFINGTLVDVQLDNIELYFISAYTKGLITAEQFERYIKTIFDKSMLDKFRELALSEKNDSLVTIIDERLAFMETLPEVPNSPIQVFHGVFCDIISHLDEYNVYYLLFRFFHYAVTNFMQDNFAEAEKLAQFAYIFYLYSQKNNESHYQEYIKRYKIALQLLLSATDGAFLDKYGCKMFDNEYSDIASLIDLYLKYNDADDEIALLTRHILLEYTGISGVSKNFLEPLMGGLIGKSHKLYQLRSRTRRK